ncbi:MAG TPA: hypothetical protein VGP65_14055 [Candidatus Angelobacter sp.]|jgi:hypothetical protein|nr:hypothetical protein [Candidatus Angelobacter sp.]
MKKYIVPTMVFMLVAAGIFVRYEIVAPARAATRDLEAINGLTVGKTTEAELLGRSAFQKIDRQCVQAHCVYHTVRTNRLLSALGLAPPVFFGTRVVVRDGLVTEVSVYISNGTRVPLSLSQKMPLPEGCSSNPCVKPAILPTKALVSIMILFNNESEFRNRMPEAIQTACLSRMHGCSSYDELMPLARGLNLDAIASIK